MSELNVTSDSLPPPVPVFNCIVYVGRREGKVRARVANLPGIEHSAADERAAIGGVVPEFKRQVGELTASGAAIPWIDPPLPPEPDEQTRLIPVHL